MPRKKNCGKTGRMLHTYCDSAWRGRIKAQLRGAAVMKHLEARSVKVLNDGTVTMTFVEYDLCEESAIKCGYCLTDWYPSMDSARKMISQFADNVLFIIWILHSSPKKELTAAEKQVKSFLNSELNHRLILV